MSDLALFDLEAPAWAIIQDEPFDWEAYECAPKDQKKALRKAYAATWRCGLCGRDASRMPWTRGCSGSTTNRVCDDCAAIDGCEHRHEVLPDECPTWPAEHVSHWGIRHTSAEHDEHERVQARRRAAYLRESGDSGGAS